MREKLFLRTVAISCLPLILTSCNLWDVCENCSAPELAISELQLQGVAITTSSFPFPEVIETSTVTDAEYTQGDPTEYLESYETSLYFSPAIDQAISVQPDNNEWDEHPYAYSFSELVNGDYRIIKPLLPFYFSVAPTTDLTSEYAPIKIVNQPSELILYGNHVLKAVAAFPQNATHVELWYRQQREDELTLVRPAALENFHA